MLRREAATIFLVDTPEKLGRIGRTVSFESLLCCDTEIFGIIFSAQLSPHPNF